jgi:hypothetical protein
MKVIMELSAMVPFSGKTISTEGGGNLSIAPETFCLNDALFSPKASEYNPGR